MNLLCSITIALFTLCCVWQGNTLRLIKVVVPPYKFRGESALLECLFELKGSKNRGIEGGGSDAPGGGGNRDRNGGYYRNQYENNEEDNEAESLYSVKWYKDNEEFYRFVPKANPPQHSYKIEGVRVDHQHSDSNRVMLRGITLKSTGLYRCEVSGEAPNFASTQGEDRMEVIYLPRDGPHISGEENQYQIGDILSLNCSSGKSHPASSLHWYINNELVINPNSLVRYPSIHHSHGLVTTRLGLNLPLDGRHFYNGAMHIKCVANLSPVLWRGGKESVVQTRPQLMENREAMLLVRNEASKNIIKLIITSFLPVICSIIL